MSKFAYPLSLARWLFAFDDTLHWRINNWTHKTCSGSVHRQCDCFLDAFGIDFTCWQHIGFRLFYLGSLKLTFCLLLSLCSLIFKFLWHTIRIIWIIFQHHCHDFCEISRHNSIQLIHVSTSLFIIFIIWPVFHILLPNIGLQAIKTV